MSKQYIPTAIAKFDQWQKNFVDQVDKGSAAWNIPNARVNDLKAIQTQWDTDYARGGKEADRKHSDTVAMQQTHELYVKALRDFVAEFIRHNSLVSDEQRAAMGVTVPDTEPTPRPPITTAPTVRATAEGGGRIGIECRVEGDSSRPSMHPDADIVELRYSLGEPAPEAPEQTSEQHNSSRSSFVLQIDITEQGKRFYGYARWANTSDESKSGPWTERFRLIVA